MKKIVLNISENYYEKLRFEAMIQKKSITQVAVDRLLENPFSNETENAYNKFFDKSFDQMLRE